MKKMIFFAANILLLLAAILWMVFAQKPTEGMFPRLSSEAVDKIKKHSILTDKDILEVLCYNGKELPFDAERGIFYLPLSMSTEEWEEGKLTSGTEGIGIAFLNDVEQESKTDIMKKGTEIPFYAYSGREYREYRLVVTGLPVIEITTKEAAEGDGDGLYHARVLDADTKEHWVVESDMLMHVRGNTSRNYPKKGYKMQLVEQKASGEYKGNKESLLGFRKDDDWVLYAMYNDGTKVRDKLCMDIWNSYGASSNSFGGKLGTDLAYVEVVWDGAYHGIYGLMEPIDSKQMNLEKEDGVHLTEYMYKRKNPTGLNLEELSKESFDQMREGFEIKGGREGGDFTDWKPLTDLIAWQQQDSDEQFARDAEGFVNIDNAVDLWLFTNIITGYDHIAKNVYYVAKNEGGAYRFYFAPWDMDLTWGYSSDPDYPLSTKYEEFLTENYIWWEPGSRMMRTNAAGAREKAQERYKDLRENILTDEWLMGRIEELQKQVEDSGAMARDEARWPEGNHDRSYEELKIYAQRRMEWLDTFMSDIETGLKDW